MSIYNWQLFEMLGLLRRVAVRYNLALKAYGNAINALCTREQNAISVLKSTPIGATIDDWCAMLGNGADMECFTKLTAERTAFLRTNQVRHMRQARLKLPTRLMHDFANNDDVVGALISTNSIPVERNEPAYVRTLVCLYCSMAELHRMLKHHSFAEYFYRKALVYAPEDTSIYVAYGTLAEENRRPRLAEFCYRRIIHIHPQYAHAHMMLGRLLVHKPTTRYDEGVACLQRAHEIDPLHPDYVDVLVVAMSDGLSIARINSVIELLRHWLERLQDLTKFEQTVEMVLVNYTQSNQPCYANRLRAQRLVMIERAKNHIMSATGRLALATDSYKQRRTKMRHNIASQLNRYARLLLARSSNADDDCNRNNNNSTDAELNPYKRSAVVAVLNVMGQSTSLMPPALIADIIDRGSNRNTLRDLVPSQLVPPRKRGRPPTIATLVAKQSAAVYQRMVTTVNTHCEAMNDAVNDDSIDSSLAKRRRLT